MRPQDPRAQQWRELLRRELDDARITQSQLADVLGVTQSMVSLWLKDDGRHGPPEPDVVFAIEDALGCPDRLATVLGYVRPQKVPTVVQAIRLDPALDQGQRQMLLATYQSAAKTRGQRRR